MRKDQEYVDAINNLIPIAEREARVKVVLLAGKRSEKRPGPDGHDYNHCFFTQFFHEAMIRLGVENGLRSF